MNLLKGGEKICVLELIYILIVSLLIIVQVENNVVLIILAAAQSAIVLQLVKLKKSTVSRLDGRLL